MKEQYSEPIILLTKVVIEKGIATSYGREGDAGPGLFEHEDFSYDF